MSTKWSSNGLLAVNTEDYEDVFSNLDDFSDISDDQKNFPIDWYFPIINVREDDQWLLLENESHISDVCNIFKDKLLCEFQTEIFLQHPLVILKLIKWLNENKETDLILECLNYLVEELIKRHYEYTTGLSENFESINFNNDSSSQITILDSENTTNDGISRWGIAKFCVSMLPLILKHISYNSIGAFSLFMSNIHLLSSISESCNVNFYLDSVFYNYMTKNLLLNEPLSSLKLLVIAKKLLTFCLHNDKFKNIIGSILKQPYWIHLYPELYHQLYAHIINEEPLELKIIKMVENVHILLSTNMLDMKQHAQLFKTALPIMWFHKKFHIIDKFIIDTCKHVKLIKINNKNEYSNILLNLLSFKSSDVVIHTYSVLNDTVKKLLNNLYSDSNKIDRLIANLLSTDVLNEIICLGCVNSNEQISQLALEFTEQLLKSKNIINNDQWQCILNNLSPILPVLYCHANQKSTLGQTIFNLFDPDQSGKFNIKKLVLLHSIIVMLLSKDNKSRIEANNRITWLLKTSLNKSIDLPNNIFIIEFEDFNDKSEEPVGEYNENDLDGMLDLISNKCSSRQTIKCALYKLSVMLEHSHLQQYFIDNGGMNTIYNLLKSSKLFENERGLLIALLKLLLCFAKENKCISNEHNLLANNFEIQLQLISILSDFYEIPLVKQYILHIFFYCIFKQYLKEFGNIPEVVMDKIYIPININKYWKSNNNYDDTLDLRIKDDKNCMDVLVLNWHLKHFNNIDLFLKNGPTMEAHCYLFNDVFKNFQKASINWYVNKLLIDLIAATSHPVALCILGDLIR
ncbi:Armadillo-like helical [Cinara cedri]|uniref:Armadillo-like helical n=1 Tax=Cinara cedri TaxID=506608 RepID=A0A5E4ML41_9HEMI|nr:Armadillo-like helical [Cinara cedri]